MHQSVTEPVGRVRVVLHEHGDVEQLVDTGVEDVPRQVGHGFEERVLDPDAADGREFEETQRGFLDPTHGLEQELPHGARDLVRCAPTDRVSELLDERRDALRAGQDPLDHVGVDPASEPRGHQLPDRVDVQRSEGEVRHVRVPPEADGEGADARVEVVPVTVGRDHQDRLFRQSTEEERHQLEDDRMRPVQVIDDQHERGRCLRQPSDLVGRGAQEVAPAPVLGSSLLGERRDERAQRLALRQRAILWQARDTQGPEVRGEVGEELGDQTGPADPRRSGDEDESEAAATSHRQRAAEVVDGVGPADERAGRRCAGRRGGLPGDGPHVIAPLPRAAPELEIPRRRGYASRSRCQPDVREERPHPGVLRRSAR